MQLVSSHVLARVQGMKKTKRGIGHKDGDALAMEVYGHLRQEHSFTQIKRVQFGHEQAASLRRAPSVHETQTHSQSHNEISSLPQNL
jgi:hypothetical protein